MQNGTVEVIEESFLAVLAPDSNQGDFRPGLYMHLSVRDTGCGMTAAVLERIFEPFYTTRRAGEGTGLGLAVVHGIVRQHAGVLKVYSSPGEGSIFHVFLPAASVAPAAPARADGTNLSAGSGQEVVCIDDDSLVLDILTNLVKRLGYRVRAFGQPALAEAFLSGPDSASTAAVICDFAMPGLDGITLAQRVGRRRSYIPWILLSGYLSEETLLRARAAGLEFFIDKPPSIEQIARTLQRVIANASSPAPGGPDARPVGSGQDATGPE
jgi:CheY-like chemotaxis protein